MAMAN